jgi:hypothetical protein
MPLSPHEPRIGTPYDVAAAIDDGVDPASLRAALVSVADATFVAKLDGWPAAHPLPAAPAATLTGAQLVAGVARIRADESIDADTGARWMQLLPPELRR